MLRRRVPVLGLGSRGPGGDQKSVSASVRQASASVAQSWEWKNVSKRRTVVTLRLALGLRVSKVSTVTSHRDRGGCGRETQNCRNFGLAFRRRISNALTVTGIGGVLVAKRRTVVTFGRGSFSLLGDRSERGVERGREGGEERG